MRRVLERLTSCFEILRTWGKKHAPVFAFTLLILGGVFLFGHHVLAAPDDKVQSTAGNFLSWGFKLISWALGNFLTIVVIPVLLAAMNFSDIINAAPVVAGWVVVRDFTNLLFIIILLIISFGIIFGQDKYGKIDMLPQLFVVAIAINFSRTIVGFLNDISMVFMQTFVKAFSDAGAGNFVDLFSVDVSKDFTAPATSTPDAIGATVLANAAGMVTLLVATIILGYLAVIMMIRIVVLWILVIIAPLAWFMKLAESWGDHTYAEWWKELKAQMVLGPIMAFFIWLALATGGAASVEFTNADVAGGKLGSGSWANNGSATTQAAIKAIIAIAILYKGLEIAQKQGGVGSSMLGKAQGMAMKAGKGALALGTGAAAYSAGLRYAGRKFGAEGGTIQRYGKATSLTAPLLADVGKGIGKVAGAVQAVPVAGSFLQRQVARAGATVSAKGAAMTKAQEEGYAKQVTGGAPEVKAETLKQLVSMDSSAQSPAQKVQMKELMKEIESDPKMLSKMSPEGMLAYKNAKEKDIKGMKDPAERRAAEHHFEEFMAKNVHRLPSQAERPVTNADGSPVIIDGKPATEKYNPQASMIDHLPADMKGKVALEAIITNPDVLKKANDVARDRDAAVEKYFMDGKTMPEKEARDWEEKARKASADVDAEETRITRNIQELGNSPVALAKLMTSSQAAASSVVKVADKNTLDKVARTGVIKDQHVQELAEDKGLPAGNMVALLQGLPASVGKAVHENMGTMSALNDSHEAWKRDDGAAKQPGAPNMSVENILGNMELHLTRVAKELEESRTQGREPRFVQSNDTLGLDQLGGPNTAQVVEQLKRMATQPQFVQVLASLPPTTLEQPSVQAAMKQVVTINHAVALDKHFTETGGGGSDNSKALFAAIAKLDDGLKKKMEEHPTVGMNLPSKV